MLAIKRIEHYLSEKELKSEFGAKGWKQLPDAISRKYHFVPAKVEVEEYHIVVYASKTDEHMVKGLKYRTGSIGKEKTYITHEGIF